MNEQLINFLYYKKEADNAEKKLSQPMIKYLNRLGIYDLQGLKTALKINKNNIRSIQQRAETAYNLIQSNSMEKHSNPDMEDINTSMEQALKNKADNTQSSSSIGTNLRLSDLRPSEMNMSEESDDQTDKTYTIPASTAAEAKEARKRAADSTLSNFAAGQSSVISAADHSSEASSSSNVRLSDVISSHTSDFTDYPVKKHHYGHVSTKDLDQSCSKVLPKLLKFLHKTSMIDNFWVNLMCHKLHVYRKTVLRTLRYLQKKGYVSKPDKFGHRDSYYGDMRYQQP